MFINEFATLLENSGIRAVQLFPDLTEIMLLMFADELVLISDTILGLQRLLNMFMNSVLKRVDYKHS